MSDTINRTLKHYHCKAYKAQFDLSSSRPKGELLGECDYYATGESDRIARSILGIKSKNVLIMHTFIDESTYSMPIDVFNANSSPEKALDSISRSYATYHATAYRGCGFDDDGNPIFELVGECDYSANKQSDKIAKKVMGITDNGIYINHVEISNTTNYMNYQTFVELANVSD